jgi:endonuclease-8
MEGPSLIILREEIEPFIAKKIKKICGNSRMPIQKLKGLKLKRVKTWGKVLFLFFSNSKQEEIVIKIHFLLFGSYRINDPKINSATRLELQFENGVLYFYACSIKFVSSEMFDELDFKVDVLSDSWDISHVVRLLKTEKKTYLCDLLLNQSIFSGSGNIVKNEVLFNIRRHPLTQLKSIRESDWPRLATAVRDYCENFYRWKKKFELRKHWQVYRQTTCRLCSSKLKRENLGKKFKRRTFYCAQHQPLRKSVCSLKVFPVLPIIDSNKKMNGEASFDH